MATAKSNAVAGTSIVPAASYSIMTTSEADMRELVRDNLGGRITARDLEIIRSPGVGGTEWKTDSGELLTTVEGIIIMRKAERSYYAAAFRPGSHTPPDCMSADMERGVGDPGGECAYCPMNEFGSAKQGEGKACREFVLLFFMRPQDAVMPTGLRVPPTSLRALNLYMRQLTRVPIAYHQIVTRCTLTGDGQGTALYSFEQVGRPEPMLLERARALREVFTGRPIAFVGETEEEIRT